MDFNFQTETVFYIFVILLCKIVKTLFFFASLMVSTVLFAQNNDNLQLIDIRARKYYSDTDILNMTPVKLAQVNFIFQRSFVINYDKPCPECPAVDLSKIDVGVVQRKIDKRKRHYQSVPGHPIDLLSIQELDAELLRIEQEFINNSSSN